MILRPPLSTLFPYTTLFRFYLNDESLYTLSLGLQYFRTSVFNVNVGAQAAYALVIALPVILVFFLAQRQFIQGISLTGIDRKSTRLNSSHANISYAVFCLKKK